MTQGLAPGTRWSLQYPHATVWVFVDVLEISKVIKLEVRKHRLAFEMNEVMHPKYP